MTISQILRTDTFYLFGAFQGIVLVVLLLIKARSKANYILATLIFLLSFYLSEQVIYLSGDIIKYPHLLYATLPITFLIGPLFYHYIRLNLISSPPWKLKHILHLTPFLYELAILFPFYTLSAESKISIYKYSLLPQEYVYFDKYALGYLIYLFTTIAFIILSHNALLHARPKDKRASKKKDLLVRISRVITAYLMINIILFTISFFEPHFIKEIQLLSPLLLSLLIHAIGFICFLNPTVISTGGNPKKYENSNLNKNQVEDLSNSLVSLINKKSLYLKQELTPIELADELRISTTNLSRIISEGLNTNFYSLINERRINRAKALLVSKDYSEAKLIHIALDSGFSNKSSFLRNFKRFTRMSPLDFRKKELHSSERNSRT